MDFADPTPQAVEIKDWVAALRPTAQSSGPTEAGQLITAWAVLELAAAVDRFGEALSTELPQDGDTDE